MKQINIDIKKPDKDSIEEWVGRTFQVIQDAATEDVAFMSAEAFNGIDHSGYTVLETFDPATVTTAELARAFATFLQYIQNQGPRKS